MVQMAEITAGEFAVCTVASLECGFEKELPLAPFESSNDRLCHSVARSHVRHAPAAVSDARRKASMHQHAGRLACAAILRCRCAVALSLPGGSQALGRGCDFETGEATLSVSQATILEPLHSNKQHVAHGSVLHHRCCGDGDDDRLDLSSYHIPAACSLAPHGKASHGCRCLRKRGRARGESRLPLVQRSLVLST